VVPVKDLGGACTFTRAGSTDTSRVAIVMACSTRRF
jgi:hypothetical protein